LLSQAPIIVLRDKLELGFVRTVLNNGARGCIPWTMGFEIVVQVIRFVLAGGIYLPPDILLEGSSETMSQGSQAATDQPTATVSTVTVSALSKGFPSSGAMTRRELAVIQAIQQGKSSKLIAYQLNMCESTVKVHVRNIMRKLAAKN